MRSALDPKLGGRERIRLKFSRNEAKYVLGHVFGFSFEYNFVNSFGS